MRPSSTKPFWFSPGSGLLGPVVLKEPSVSMLGKCKIVKGPVVLKEPSILMSGKCMVICYTVLTCDLLYSEENEIFFVHDRIYN